VRTVSGGEHNHLDIKERETEKKNQCVRTTEQEHHHIMRTFLTSFVAISDKMKSVVETLLSVSAAATGMSFIGVECKLDDDGDTL
jgi:hypothetical protein